MYLKRVSILLLSLLFIITISANPVDADEIKVNVDKLNVRSSPSIESDIVDQIQADEIYPVLQGEENWMQIQLADKTGWVLSEYVTTYKEDNEVQVSTTSKIKVITTTDDNIHMRSGPSTENPIISYIKKGTKLTAVKEEDHWYQVDYNGDTGYIFDKFFDTKQATSLANKVITIDPGHGGLDVGSISSSGTYEKDLTILTALKLKEKLVSLGAKVILTRSKDDYIRLASRTTLASISNSDVFISLHYNSFPEMPNISGIETYYYQDKNKQLAQHIQQELIKETNANNRQTTYADYQVLRQTHIPAILIELGFVSNKDSEQLILTKAYQEKLVSGIINGLNNYFLEL